MENERSLDSQGGNVVDMLKFKTARKERENLAGYINDHRDFFSGIGIDTSNLSDEQVLDLIIWKMMLQNVISLLSI